MSKKHPGNPKKTAKEQMTEGDIMIDVTERYKGKLIIYSVWIRGPALAKIENIREHLALKLDDTMWKIAEGKLRVDHEEKLKMVDAFFAEKTRKKHTCELCGVVYVNVKFGQNQSSFTAEGKRHTKYEGRCWLDRQ
jgi:hypothetical protein